MFYKRFAAVIAAVMAWSLLVQPAALAYPLAGWDQGNHTLINLTDPQGKVIGLGGVILPDTIEVACPAAPVATNIATATCWQAPNDGHTYTVTGYATRLTANAAGATCTTNIEVAGAGVAAGSGTGQLTPVPCSTAVVANTSQNGTVISAASTITAGSSVNLVVVGTATATTGLYGTVSIQRAS